MVEVVASVAVVDGAVVGCWVWHSSYDGPDGPTVTEHSFSTPSKSWHSLTSRSYKK